MGNKVHVPVYPGKQKDVKKKKSLSRQPPAWVPQAAREASFAGTRLPSHQQSGTGKC